MGDGFMGSFGVVLSTVVGGVYRLYGFFRHGNFPSGEYASSRYFGHYLSFFLHMIGFYQVLRSVYRDLSSLIGKNASGARRGLFVLCLRQ